MTIFAALFPNRSSSQPLPEHYRGSVQAIANLLNSYIIVVPIDKKVYFFADVNEGTQIPDTVINKFTDDVFRTIHFTWTLLPTSKREEIEKSLLPGQFQSFSPDFP